MSYIIKMLVYLTVAYTLYVQIVIIAIPNIIFMLEILIISILTLILIAEIKRRKSLLFISIEIIFLVLFLVYTLLGGVLISKNINILLDTWLIVAQALTVFIIISYTIYKGHLDLNQLLKVISISSFLISIHMIFFGVSFQSGRLSIANVNPNVVATIINMGTISILFLFKEKAIVGKIYSIIVLVFYFFGLALTGARMGIVGFSFLVIFYVILAYLPFLERNINKILKQIGILIFTTMLTYIAVKYLIDMTVLGERIRGIGYEGDQVRITLYEKAWELFKEAPILGLGLNGFALHTGMYSHSTYAELIVNTGVIGLILFLVIFISLFKKGIILLKVASNNEEKSKAALCLIVIVYLIIIGFGTVHFYELNSFIILAIIHSYININLSKKNQTAKMEGKI